MVFSSPVFVLAFLPFLLLVYQVTKASLKNMVLLIFSLLFYAWGEGEMVVIMLGSITMNYFIALFIDSAEQKWSRNLWLSIGIAANLILLFYYKYTNFFLTNYNQIALSLGKSSVIWDTIILPLGISFFTFQGISYIIDVYRKETTVQKNPVDLALYITFFPQLIAGPIVRYHDISLQLNDRSVTPDLMVSGIKRFIIGLTKKIIIADQVGRVSAVLFSGNPDELNAGLAWLGMISSVVQIYFDFSGYSDMAIGLGRMFGFTFLENFLHPLSMKNMRKFWTHWHISLSNWFKDYIYLPLGGNKKGPWRTHFNLWLIFFLSGLWHGAEWTFVLFGVFHGIFMVAERLGMEKILNKLPGFIQNIYVWLVFSLSIILFSSPSIEFAWTYIQQLFNFNVDITFHQVWIYLDFSFWAIFISGIILCYPIKAYITNSKAIKELTDKEILLKYKNILSYGVYFILLFFTMAAMAGSTYSPFIYFRF